MASAALLTDYQHDLRPAKIIRLILGDQLNLSHSWYQQVSDDVVYLMAEQLSETDYVTHHIQKVIAFFLAMRARASQLRAAGHRVIYYKITDPDNKQSFDANVKYLFQQTGATGFEYQLPDEYRLDRSFSLLADELQKDSIVVKVVDTEHFMTSRTFLADLFKGKKTYLMERFYRQVRQDYNLLMQPDGKTPEGDRWNFDAENRKKFDNKVLVPAWPTINLGLQDECVQIITDLQNLGVKTIGRMPATGLLNHPVTRADALVWLEFFVKHCLPHFGTYEDAMDSSHPTLFHSRLSFALNVKLLSPLEVVNAAIAAYRSSLHPDSKQQTITLAQIEGFVRQIIGWREYMRGIYWARMPEYATLNYFGHQAALPDWYWTGKTRMRCMADAINNSLDHAYAHHIQRLMLTGNFALLLGVNPDEVDQWYLGIYIDALEWVEITNTRGMSQFADGGIVGTKPYVSAAAYVDKMSNYCQGCYYDRKKRHGDKACPFNSLYWDFYHRHQDLLAKNPRIGMAYATLNKMDQEELTKTIEHAAKMKQTVNEL